jgi:glycerol-3-phosphate dehydrogenase
MTSTADSKGETKSSSQETSSTEASKAPEVKALQVTVFGDGTFGTALATVFARRVGLARRVGAASDTLCMVQGHFVTILTRREGRYKSINEQHKNEKYLSEYTLHSNIRAELEPAKALKGVQLIVHSIPVQSSFDVSASKPAV